MASLRAQVVESCGLRWVRDVVLSHDDRPIDQPGRDVVTEIGVDGWNDTNYVVLDAAYAAEQVNCTLETAAKQSGSGEKEVAYGSGGEVKGGCWGTGTLEDLQIHDVEEGSDEFLLRRRNVAPDGRDARHDVVPLRLRLA